ncbi:adenylate/guanylate cyclase domain-containing protein [Roseibium sp.]|uniref:adenylate/guanylate cyclase domain-containing protein n=1 Tax=Roseibium sp. TaxID=1936156 RepID=UPI003D126C70
MGSRPDGRRTLRAKFLRITIPLIFLSVIGVFSIIEVMTHLNTVARLERTLAGLADTQAAALANPLWNLDHEQIRLALEAVVTNREILSASVLGEDNQLMSTAGAVPEGTSGSDLMHLNREIVFDAGAGPKTIGTLEFVATRGFVWEQTRNRLVIAAIIALLAVSIEVAAALYALATIIGRPLQELLKAINRAKSGAAREPVAWHSSDELGQVIAAFNEMQELQQAYEKDLREARDTLEDRVRERTAELARARDESLMARARLGDAIEAISEGFSLYDKEDRLVIANSRYNEILNLKDLTDIRLMQPGRDFRTILQAAVDHGLIEDALEDVDGWIEERVNRHRNPGKAHVQRYANGRWVRVSERRTQDGGTVAVYSDITELKQREEELASKSSQLEQLSKQLSKYLAPQLYESIFQGRQEVKIAATRKKLTVFFSDIADFTETAERMESEELTQLLNHYLTEMSRIALDHGATIDKYVGDAIVIFFGDPQSRGVKEDAKACVRMAIEMRQRMKELAEEWREAGIARPLRCRMGIHTDFCTVGNFGSEDRLDYTIIGRGVNIASRLESLATPGEILLSFETHAHVAEEIACEAQGEVEVKGLAYPIATYRVAQDGRKALLDGHRLEARSLLEADPSSLSETDRAQAVTMLKEALHRFSAASSPSPDE